MAAWGTLTIEERSAAVRAGLAAGQDAVKLGRLHRTSPAAIEGHARRQGILLPVSGANPPPAAGQATRLQSPNGGGDHVVPKSPSPISKAALADDPRPAPLAQRVRYGEDGWTDEKVARLKQLLADGNTASQIAAQLGGVSRNAVIGKAARLSLQLSSRKVSSTKRPKRTTPISGVDVRKIAAARKGVRPTVNPTNIRGKAEGRQFDPGEATLPPDAPSPPDCQPVALADLKPFTEENSHCRWPVGLETGLGQMFCGAPKPDFKEPYCAWHANIAAGRAGPAWTPERRQRQLAAIQKRNAARASNAWGAA